MAHYQDIGERFIRYASITTQSKEGVADTPSTECQRDLARLLTEELQEMGAADVYYDEKHCYVYATIPSNLPVTEEMQDALALRTDTAQKRRENPTLPDGPKM